MGRLKRDRRMVGLFPSNFVELLAENGYPAAAFESSEKRQQALLDRCSLADVACDLAEAQQPAAPDFFAAASCSMA